MQWSICWISQRWSSLVSGAASWTKTNRQFSIVYEKYIYYWHSFCWLEKTACIKFLILFFCSCFFFQESEIFPSEKINDTLNPVVPVLPQLGENIEYFLVSEIIVIYQNRGKLFVMTFILFIYFCYFIVSKIPKYLHIVFLLESLMAW